MHSARELSSDAFSLTVDRSPASLDDVFPGFHVQDRLGVVVRQPGGALGASGLIMAAVTGFYDFQRASGRDFFIYPDYFLFHAGRRHGDHSMLDIWPDHKEVVIIGDAEDLLQAINDRGITRLLVADGQPGDAEIKRHTRESAECRLRSALVYDRTGCVPDADVSITSNVATEGYVKAVIEKSPQFTEEIRGDLRLLRSALTAGDVATESYRRIATSLALDMLESIAS